LATATADGESPVDRPNRRIQMGFKLTQLEKSALLKKAGLVKSLLESRDIHVQEISGTYDPEKSPEGSRRWDGENDDSWTEETKCIHRASLSGKQFVILVVYGRGFERSHSRSRDDERWEDEKYFIFQSEGEALDAARVSREKLEKLIRSAERHLPEALDMFREEYVAVK